MTAVRKHFCAFYRGIALLLYTGVSAVAHAQLPPSVEQALTAAGVPPAAVSLWIGPVDADNPTAAYLADTLRNPASVMKLVTTYAALDLLGPQYTWTSAAYLDAPVVEGVLNGNLILQGSGDPVLTWDKFGQWLRDMRLRGLRQINGDLVIDRSFFAGYMTGDSNGFDDIPWRAYNARPDALLLNFNALTLRLASKGSQATVVSLIPFKNLTIDNQLELSQGPCGNWKGALYPHVEFNEKGLQVRLRGRYAQECDEKLLHLSVDDSAQFAAGIFRSLWQELGGTWIGKLRVVDTPSTSPTSLAVFAKWESPPLADILRDMNKFSNNTIARQIFLNLKALDPTPAHNAEQLIRARMASKDLNLPSLALENGSGLSRKERISAQDLAALLKSVWHDARMPDFVSTLPIAGLDGTVKKRFKNNSITGRAYLKTGTLNDVKATAGYVLDASGKWQIVVFIVNHPRAEYTEAAHDAAVTAAFFNRMPIVTH